MHVEFNLKRPVLIKIFLNMICLIFCQRALMSQQSPQENGGKKAKAATTVTDQGPLKAEMTSESKEKVKSL